MAELVAAVDIGGTTVKGGLYDEAGTVFGERQLMTGATGGGVGLLNAVIGLVRRLIESAPGAVVAAGLVSPGAEARSGTVRRAVNLDWADLPLAGAVREAVGIPVAVEHDVRAAARAEATFGAARGVSEVFFVALGTGVAGAHVVGGRAG
ncbi:MAG: ROK family protein, partial [Actinomycetota bacterium]|nr:ROK family protein [Actinomycetota bacterium]